MAKNRSGQSRTGQSRPGQNRQLTKPQRPANEAKDVAPALASGQPGSPDMDRVAKTVEETGIDAPVSSADAGPGDPTRSELVTAYRAHLEARAAYESAQKVVEDLR